MYQTSTFDRFRVFYRPHNIAILMACFSAAVWALPSGDSSIPRLERIGAGSLLYTLLWYVSIYVSSMAGFSLGRRNAARPAIHLTPEDEYVSYLAYTVLATVGSLATYFSSLQAVSEHFMELVEGRTFNDLRTALYSEYALGLHTLRYTTILSGGIASYQVLFRKSRKILHLYNILLLLAIAAVSSRLSLVFAIILAIGLALGDPSVRFKSTRWILSVVAIVFFVITALNYLRNANYYETVHNVSNPISMSLLELKRYVSTPFNVTLGTSRLIGEGYSPSESLEQGLIQVTLPSYFQKRPDVYRMGWSHEVMELDSSLTTNSSLEYLFGNLGVFAFPFISVVVFIMALLCGWFSRLNGLLALPSFCIVYAFWDLWRLYIFSEGIFHFLILASVGIPMLTKVMITPAVIRMGIILRSSPGTAPPNHSA